MAHPAGLPPADSPFEAEDDSNFTTDAKMARQPWLASEGWWVATVLPRALRFKRPLHRCNACNPGKDHDTKAEWASQALRIGCPKETFASRTAVNRCGEVCDVLTGTGISCRKIDLPSCGLGEGWSSIRVSRPVILLGRSLQTATSVYLSTPMLGEMESRTGIAPVSAALQAAA